MAHPTAPAASLEVPLAGRPRLAEIARHHGIRLLLAFGSRVNGHSHAASDLDLAVLLQHGGGGDLIALLGDLQGVFPGQDVDLVWLNRADPLLAWQVCRKAQLLFGDAQDFALRRAYAWRRFVEYDRFFRLEREAVRRRIDRLRHAGR